MVTNSCSILYNFGIITADYNINYCSINCTCFFILFKFLKLPVVSIWSTVALKISRSSMLLVLEPFLQGFMLLHFK